MPSKEHFSSNTRVNQQTPAEELRKLQKQIDEINNKADRLERFIESCEAAYHAEWSREKIDHLFTLWEERGSSALERDIRVHDARRRGADHWYTQDRPGQIAELRQLRETERSLKDSLFNAFQHEVRHTSAKKRGRPRDGRLDELAVEVYDLKDGQKKSWTLIAREMRRRYPNENFPVSRCRSLYNRLSSASEQQTSC